MIEITQVNASLDEASDENACLIVGKRVAKRVLRCKDSEIKSIELHRKSIDARKKRDSVGSGEGKDPGCFVEGDCHEWGLLFL